MKKDDYSDIIHLPHYVSKKRPQMSIEQRSAQFAPFAALTGYEGQVKETARFTDKRIELDEEMKCILDRKIHIIQEMILTKPKVEVTYFVYDKRKDGGKYITIIDNVIKIDNYNKHFIMHSGLEIDIKEILDICIKT